MIMPEAFPTPHHEHPENLPGTTIERAIETLTGEANAHLTALRELAKNGITYEAQADQVQNILTAATTDITGEIEKFTRSIELLKGLPPES